MLQFPPKWRFEAPRYADQRRNAIPPDAIAEFMRLIKIVSSQGPEKQILEHYKRRFSTAIGVPYYPSSSSGWAETDLELVLTQAAQNPPVFVEAFYDAGEILRTEPESRSIPDVEMTNDILNRHGLALKIEGTNLVAADAATLAIPISEIPLSLAEQARQQLMASSKRADTLLAEGRGREAVQENLWLLETIATAFRGLDTGTGTIEGNYFNQIVRELRQLHSNTTLERVLQWANAIHGYLSSPAGGGVRHGLDLNSGIELTLNEAQLFCNLIRSFISFLLLEYERFNQQAQ
jgi:hypothetical protein